MIACCAVENGNRFSNEVQNGLFYFCYVNDYRIVLFSSNEVENRSSSYEIDEVIAHPVQFVLLGV